MNTDVLIPICQRLRRLRVANEALGDRKLRVGILGAGIAGLTAAWELSELGHEVAIYEGSDRIGGRIFTHRFGDGDPERRVELGAMRIPPNHDYTHHYISLLGLELRRFLNASVCNNGFYDLRGKLGLVKDFGRDFLLPPARGAKPLFQLHTLERGLALDGNAGPGALMGFVLAEEVQKVRELGEVGKLLRGEIDTPNLRRLDSMTLGRRLSELLSVEGRYLTDAAAPVGGLADRSLAMHVRDAFTIKAHCLDEIQGGLDRLPKGLAEALRRSKGVAIEMEREVVQLERTTVAGRSRARVTFRGTAEPVEFDLLICTLPFPVLKAMGRAVKGLSEEKMAAIQGMSYTSSTKVGLDCSERFWEQKYGIFGGRSVTDHPTGQLYYPSATADVSPCGDLDGILAEGEGEPIASLPALAHTASDCPCDVSALQSKALETKEPGVLLAYNWGGESRGFCQKSPTAAFQQVIDDVARFHPEIRDVTKADEEHGAIMCWDSYKWTRGAFAALKPGELTAHYRNGLQREGCLFFAGEHLSPVPGWIQGAVSSALFQMERLLEYAAHFDG